MKAWTALALIFGVFACSPDQPKHGSSGRRGPGQIIIRIEGPSPVHPLLSQATERFMLIHPELNVEVSQRPSGTTIEHLIKGTIDIAATARVPTLAEFEAAQIKKIPLKTYPIAHDGLVIMIHPDRARDITGLNNDEARRIFFEGSLVDWSALHPRAEGSIIPYVRDPMLSGEAETFGKYITGQSGAPYAANAVRVSTAAEIISHIAQDPNGIGIAPYSLVDSSVHLLAYGHDRDSQVFPTADAVRNLSYPLRLDLFLITNGTPTGPIADFVLFMLGKESRDIYERVGLIKLD